MNIVITWPKTRSLRSYLDELQRAHEHDLVINYRVPSLPKAYYGDSCYMVHDGFIRGWNYVLATEYRSDVRDPIDGNLWPPGFYVVRDPEWHPIDPEPMKGFQGYRYLQR